MGLDKSTFIATHYSGRRVLVTGSTGFKGAWLCHMLTKLGADVCGYALKPPTIPSLWEEASIAPDVIQVTNDIRDFAALESTFRRFQPQTVLHLAAQPLVIESYAQPRYTYETNVMGTVNVLECVRTTPSVTSFLNVTTDKVYENREIEDYGYREDDKLDGHDPYSNSKSCSELVTHSYACSFFAQDDHGGSAYRCAISTARAGNVIGGGDFAAHRIVPDCVRAALEGKPLILRNPNSVRPFQHVLEPLVAYLLIAALQVENSTKQGWYNIGPSKQDCVTTGQLVTYFADAWGRTFKWETQMQAGPHEANYLKLNNDKARQVLGWQPCWNVREAVQRTVDWTRAWQSGNARKEMDRQVQDYLGALA